MPVAYGNHSNVRPVLVGPRDFAHVSSFSQKIISHPEVSFFPRNIDIVHSKFNYKMLILT